MILIIRSWLKASSSGFSDSIGSIHTFLVRKNFINGNITAGVITFSKEEEQNKKQEQEELQLFLGIDVKRRLDFDRKKEVDEITPLSRQLKKIES